MTLCLGKKVKLIKPKEGSLGLSQDLIIVPINTIGTIINHVVFDGKTTYFIELDDPKYDMLILEVAESDIEFI